MVLACLLLALCYFGLRLPELQGLECSLVDRDPGTKLRPSMAHDLELSPDRQQLALRCILNFYCELIHINLIFVNSMSDFSLILLPSWFRTLSTWDLISELEKFFSSNHRITSTRTSRCFFTNLIVLSNDMVFLSLIVKISSYHLWDRLSSLLLACCCLLVSSFRNFLHLRT